MNSIKRRHIEPSEELEAFARQFDRCWLCGTLARNTWPPKLEIHHIVRGQNRQKGRVERCVMIRTCQRCHQQRLDAMEISTQLALKKINDEPHYDREAVNAMRGRAPNAVSEGDVMVDVLVLTEQSLDTGFPFPKWSW